MHDNVNANTYIMLILFYILSIGLSGEDLNIYNYERVSAVVLWKPVNSVVWENIENDLWLYNKSMQWIPRSADLKSLVNKNCNQIWKYQHAGNRITEIDFQIIISSKIIIIHLNKYSNICKHIHSISYAYMI